MGTKITSMEYDILLKDGTVIAPSEGLNDQVDVAIANGQVAAVSKNIDPQKAERTISWVPYPSTGNTLQASFQGSTVMGL